MAAHSMYFPKSQFQLGSPLILVMAPELTEFFYSYYYSDIRVTLGLFPMWFSDRTMINMINWYAD